MSSPPTVLAIAQRVVDIPLNKHHRFGREILRKAIYDRTGRLTDRSGDAVETLKYDQAGAGLRRDGKQDKA